MLKPLFILLFSLDLSLISSQIIPNDNAHTFEKDIESLFNSNSNSKFQPSEKSIENYDKAMDLLNNYHTPRSIIDTEIPKQFSKPSIISKYLDYIYMYSDKNLKSDQEQQQSPKSPSSTLGKATSLLEQAAIDDHPDALYVLANMYLFSHYELSRDIPKAFEYFKRLADVHGNVTAHHYLGIIYGTGLGGIPIDGSKAILHQSFAARFGHRGSKMALAYRYANGIGLPEHCESALYLYSSLADDAMEEFYTGPIGGHFLPQSPLRLSDHHGGAYGVNIDPQDDPDTLQNESKIANIIEYLRHKANKGDDNAMWSLGMALYNGNLHIGRNHAQAHAYLSKIYQKYVEHDDVKTLGEVKGKLMGQVSGLLGLMSLRGEHIEQSNSTAADYFLKGTKFNDGLSQTWYGIMLMEGSVKSEVGKPTIDLGISYLKKAHENRNALAMIRLGLHFSDLDAKYSANMFLSAYALGNYEGAYRFAQSIENRQGMCSIAIKYYSIVVNRMDWSHSPHRDALKFFKANDYENALIYYLEQAEMGLEVAQSNVAWLIDNNYPINSLNMKDKKWWLALLYWTRSSNHDISASMLKMGDYHYEGKGTEKNPSKAFSCYSHAAQAHQSSMGYWNMGWMHENGVGAPKDFYLAKRFYDLSYHYNPSASLPVTLSLIKLNFKFFYNYLFHGVDAKGVSSFMNPTQPNNPATFNDETDPNQQGQINDQSNKKLPTWEQWKNQEDEGEGNDEFNLDDAIVVTISFEQIVICTLCLFVGYLIYLRQNRRNQPANNAQPNN